MGRLPSAGIEMLPSGKYRGVVRGNVEKLTTMAVATRCEASMLEARLEMRMGALPAERSVSVAELLQMQLDRGNYSPTSLADILSIVERLPVGFTRRSVRDVTPFVLDALYRQLAKRRVVGVSHPPGPRHCRSQLPQASDSVPLGREQPGARRSTPSRADCRDQAPERR
jgi:hypothetical protein